MTAITRLCRRAICLEQGRIAADGPAPEVAARYLRSDLGTIAERAWAEPSAAPGDQVARLRSVNVIAHDNACNASIDIRRPVVLEMTYDVLQAGHRVISGFHLFNEEGICVFVTLDTDPQWRGQPKPAGRYRSRVTIPPNFLSEGTFTVDAALGGLHPTPTVHVHEREVLAFQVIDSMDGDSVRGDYGGEMPGVVRPWLQWRTDLQDEAALNDQPLRHT